MPSWCTAGCSGQDWVPNVGSQDLPSYPSARAVLSAVVLTDVIGMGVRCTWGPAEGQVGAEMQPRLRPWGQQLWHGRRPPEEGAPSANWHRWSLWAVLAHPRLPALTQTMSFQRSGAPGLPAVGAVAAAAGGGLGPAASPPPPPSTVPATCPLVLARREPRGLQRRPLRRWARPPGNAGLVGGRGPEKGGRQLTEAVVWPRPRPSPDAVGTESLVRAGPPHQPGLLSSQRHRGQGPLGLPQ